MSNSPSCNCGLMISRMGIRINEVSAIQYGQCRGGALAAPLAKNNQTLTGRTVSATLPHGLIFRCEIGL